MRVLITGCATGFGRELVRGFLADGWDVIATMRNVPAREAEFDEEIRRFGPKLVFLEMDVTSAPQRADVEAYVRSTGGRLDCVVNNAGYGTFGALEDLSEEQIRAQMEVNFFGLALVTRGLLPFLRQAKGRVINLSSAMGFSGFPLTSVYCASKFAVEGLSEALRYELAPHGVQVTIVEPGAFRTRFGRNVRWGERSDDRTSAYALQTSNYRRLQARLMSGPGNPPDVVVRRILELAKRRRMPLRARCGRDAAFLHWVQRLLPEGVQTLIFGRFYRKMFSRPALSTEAVGAP